MSLRCCFALLIAVMTGLGSPGAGKAADFTDAQKRSAVYRLYAEYKREFPSVKDISPDEARAEFTAGTAVFVDTRTSAEIAVSKIPGAVTEERFRKDPQRYAGKTAIAYCTISYRSGLFAKEMAERGIQVINLRGGILAWTLEGGQVVDPEGRAVRRLHVYSQKWNYAPEGYEVVMFGWLERLLGRNP